MERKEKEGWQPASCCCCYIEFDLFRNLRTFPDSNKVVIRRFQHLQVIGPILIRMGRRILFLISQPLQMII
uniref:Uncharacterized protein n=1 Tax=Salix viminalis TaxID=40686 RepID=A0A6N2M657_SALVM